MDITAFSAVAPGEFISVSIPWSNGSWVQDTAFVPRPLPPQWDFPVSLWPLVAEARQQLGLLEGLGRQLPNPDLLLHPLERREAINSSTIEGTIASPRQLVLFELEPTEQTSEHDPSNSWREVANYRRALRMGTSGTWPLSRFTIRGLHQELLKGVSVNFVPGEFRSTQVVIGSSRRFIPPPPELLNDCLEAFENSIQQLMSVDGLVDCFLAHYQFEAIHPFPDGNGRVGRLLLSIMLQSRGQLSKPWLHMSSYFERFKSEYIERLFAVSTAGDWTGWIEFCLRGVIDSAHDTVRRCDLLLKLRDLFKQRVFDAGGNTRLQQLAEKLFETPYLRVTDCVKLLDITYPTAKSDLDKLVEAGLLKIDTETATRSYWAPEIVAAAFED